MASFKILFSLIFIFSVFSSLEAIADGAYRIRCHTRNGGILSLEAFPKVSEIRPRPDSTDQDQKWFVQNIGNGNYKIYCWTKNGGKRYLEAFPSNDGFVRSSGEDQVQDQLWQITTWPLDHGFYRISCRTAGSGVKSIEAFPGDNIVRVRDNSLDQDQRWQFIPW